MVIFYAVVLYLFITTVIADRSQIPSNCSFGISVTNTSSYGPSILWILHDATALNLYNLRASICRQLLDKYDEWPEDYKSGIINACAVCIDQEHPERFIDDLERKHQQIHEKRRQRKNMAIINQSIPDSFASPGFPLLVHIQICLLRHQVERAAELTRKMDSSSCLNDEVRDDAWFNIWSYLLAEGRLFLDGNLDTPGYLKKRDFLYNYMACQVSQKAKIAMIDFYQEVANRVCEQEDATLEEKQYVILACQQTVLRLLLKMRGLGLNTILEFARETKWPVEIPGQKSAKDLNVWGANFLLQKRKVPSTLIDETTGLVDLLKRTELEPEKACGLDQVDSTLSSMKRELPSAPIESSTAENEWHLRESELLSDDNRAKSSTPGDDGGFEQQTVIRASTSSVINNFYEENESGQNSEIDEEEDDGLVILDDDDDHSEVLVVENVDNDRVLDVEDVDDGEEDSDDVDEDDKFMYSDDDEDIVYSVDGNVYSDVEENNGRDVEFGNYQNEEETEIFYRSKGEDTCAQEKHIKSDDSNDDRYGQTEDEKRRMVEHSEKMNNDSYREDRKCRPDDGDNDIDEEIEDSDDFKDSPDDVEYDDSDPVDASVNVKSFVGSFGHDGSNTSQGADTPRNNHESNQVVGVDMYENAADSDASPENSTQNSEDLSVVEVDSEVVDTENPQLSESSPSFETANNQNERKEDVANDYDVTDPDHKHLPKTHKDRADIAAVRGEFGDTTEEEDGNDRFRANRTAQADRRADALTVGVGYASQEDGYEPEDTHGYTEEEVSEAIHTEDEEDERILEQKPHFSDIDTSQHQTGHTSHTDIEDATRLLSGQSRDIVGNTDRQNSIEPASDDMDMADERTEQEEDVVAEFSELEENPECSFELQIPPSESTQAKTLLEFAQKAQNKDNWVDHLKDTESISDDVGSKINDTPEVGQSDADDGLLPQETEFNKIGALSFDADDEKYATEGCKSLETEEEEDTEKDNRVDIFANEGVSTINDNNVNGAIDDQGNEFKTGNDEKHISAVENVQDKTQHKNLNKAQELVIVEKDHSKVYNEDVEVLVHDEDNAAIGDEDGGGAISDVNTKEILVPGKVPGRTSDEELMSDEDDCGKVDSKDVEVFAHGEDNVASGNKDCGGAISDVNTKEIPEEVSGQTSDEELVIVEKDCAKVDSEDVEVLLQDEDNVTKGNEDSGSAISDMKTQEIPEEVSGQTELVIAEKDCGEVDIEDVEVLLQDEDNVAMGKEDSCGAISDVNTKETPEDNPGQTLDKELVIVEKDCVEVDIEDVEVLLQDEDNVAKGSEASGSAISDMNTQEILEDVPGQTLDEESVVEEDCGKVDSEDVEVLLQDEDTKEVLQREESDEIGSNEGGKASDGFRNEKAGDNAARVNKKSGNVDAVNHINNDDSEHTPNKETASERKSGGINSNDMASGDSGGTFNDDTAIVADDLKEAKNDVADSVVEARLEASNTGDGTGESIIEKNEESMSLDEVCTEDRTSLSHGGALTSVDNPRSEIHDDTSSIVATEDQKSMTDDEVIIDETDAKREDQAMTGADKCQPNEDKCNDSTIAADVKLEGDTVGDAEVVAQNDTIDCLVNDAGEANEDCDDQSKEIAGKTGVGVGIEEVKDIMDVENDFDAIDNCNGEMANKKEAQLGPNQAHLQEDKPVDTSNLLNDTEFPILPSHNEEVLGINDSVEDKSFDIPQFIGGESSPQKEGSTRNNEGISGTFEKSNEDGNSIGDESVGGGDGSVISEIFQPILPKKRKRHVDEDTSVSSSSTPRSQKQASIRAKNGTAGTQRTGEDEDNGNVKSGMSVLKPSEHVEESSTRAITTSTSSLKARRGLPPRPPKEASKDPKRRITRSKKKIDDELPAQAKRSTRSSGAKAPKQKTKDIANNDDASVQTTTSKRSTRSAARKLSSGAKASKQKTEDIANNDDSSVQTTTSKRSTRSAARKLSSSAKAPKQKTEEIENDDDISVQTNKSTRSTRSTRSAAKKLSSGAKVPKRETEEIENVSVRTNTSTKSTRSAARRLSSVAKVPKHKNEVIENDDDVSVQTNKSTRSTRSAVRKLSSGAKAPKQKAKEIENDDDMSVQTNASTRSATRKLSSVATIRAPEKPAEDDDPYSDWTVKKLQVELKKRKISYSTKLRKSELKEKLKSADEAKKGKNLM